MKPAALLAAVALLAAACGKKAIAPTPADAALAQKILVRGNGPEPDSLDPHLATSVGAGNILLNLLEGLTRPNPATLAPEPGMADRWDLSADGMEYIFHLREAFWSNGDPVAAGDFVFAFRRMLDPALGASYAYMLHPLRNARAVQAGEKPASELGVEAVDARTLRVRLEDPIPHFLSLLGHWTWFPLHEASILARGAATDRASGWTRPEHLVSNGPFLLKSWQPEKEITLVKNPRYWDAANVFLEGARFVHMGDAGAEERAFRGGELHLTYTLPRHKLGVYREKHADVLRVDPYLESVGLVANVGRGPLADVRVRQALSMALDRRGLTTHVLHGVRQPAFSYVPPDTGGFAGSARLTEDVAHARTLLAEAGFPGGAGFPEIELIFPSGQDPVRVGEVLQQQWIQELGLRVSLVNLEKKTYFARRRAGDFDLAFFGWTGDYLDPETFLGLWRPDAGNNFARWRHAAYGEIMDSARGADRMSLFAVAESVLLQELPIIPLYFGATQYLIDPRVRNWHPTLLDQHPLRAVRFAD